MRISEFWWVAGSFILTLLSGVFVGQESVEMLGFLPGWAKFAIALLASFGSYITLNRIVRREQSGEVD